MRKIILVITMLGLALVGAATWSTGSATAIGTWTVPGTVFSPAPGVDPYLAIGTAPDGTVWAVHSNSGGIDVRSNATGTWSTVQSFSGASNNSAPRIGFDANGNVAIAWVNTSTPTKSAAVVRCVDGTWQAPVTVSDTAGVWNDLRLAVTPSGRIVVLYNQVVANQVSVLATIGSMTGSFAAPVSLATFDFSSDLDIATDGAGRVTMVWSQNTDTAGSAWVSTIEPSGSTASAPVKVSPNGVHTRFPVVRANANGDTYILMSTANASSTMDLRLARRAAGAASFGPATLPASGYASVMSPMYDAVVAPDGSAVVAWAVDLAPDVLRAAKVAADGTIGAAFDVQSANQFSTVGLARLVDGTTVLTFRGDSQSNQPQFWSTTMAPGAASFATPTLVVGADSTDRNWTRPVIDSAGSVWVLQKARIVTGYTTMPGLGFGGPPMQIPTFSNEVSALTTGNGVAVVPTTTSSTTPTTTIVSTSSTTVAPVGQRGADPSSDTVATTIATTAPDDPVVPVFTG